MSLMTFMEAMGTSDIAIVAAFFIGLMMAISPCPLATNITAVAYISKKIQNSRHTIMVGFVYTLGRMFTYVTLAFFIVSFGLNVQSLALPLQKYGGMLIGPFLIIMGVLMLDVIELNFLKESRKIDILKEKLSEKGYFGAFGLGVIFALAFCPFSAVLFFGMLIPLALKFSDGIFIPSVFAFATGLPVILFSFLLVYSISKMGIVMNKVQLFEKYTRTVVSMVFIGVGLYYTIIQYM